MLNIASVILLLGAAQGVFFSMALLAIPDGNRRANRWLAIFLTSFSINIAGTALHDLRVVLSAPQIGLVHTPFSLLLGVSAFFFTKNLTTKNYRMRWWDWLQLLPFVLGVLYLAPFYGLSPAEKRALLEQSYEQLPDSWALLFKLTVVVNAVYLAFTVALLFRHQRHIRQVFSNTEEKTLHWLVQFIVACVFTFSICVLLGLFDFHLADIFSNLTFAGLVYVMGYRAIRQPEIFKTIPEEVVRETHDSTLGLGKPPGRYEKSGLSDQKAGELLIRLEGLMSEEKLYLDPELTLPQLADRMSVTPHQLSQALNQHGKETFFDFVNRQRVEHFKRMAVDPANAHLSILALAFDSGFHSKASFNAVFKKMTGTTPSAFRNR